MELNKSELWLLEDLLRQESGRLELKLMDIKRKHTGLDAINVLAPVENATMRLNSVYHLLNTIGTERLLQDNPFPVIRG